MRRAIAGMLGSCALLLAVSCGGGGGGGSPSVQQGPVTSHAVTLNWASNHESGVNKAGGGYKVSVSGQPTIDVPYVSGLTTTTTTSIVLNTGSYSMTVRAYAALDAQGGVTGSLSAASTPITINVP